MLDVDLPFAPSLHLRHVVLDLNGTIATDGVLNPGVSEALIALSDTLTAHVVTADTHQVAEILRPQLPCELTHLESEGPPAVAKAQLVARLGADQCVVIGNGESDAGAMKIAGLAIGILGEEGLATACLANAKVVCRSAVDALRLLSTPKRLIGTLHG
jgi:soluble P-type ATPase